MAFPTARYLYPYIIWPKLRFDKMNVRESNLEACPWQPLLSLEYVCPNQRFARKMSEIATPLPPPPPAHTPTGLCSRQRSSFVDTRFLSLLDRFIEFICNKRHHKLPEVVDTKISHPNMIFYEELGKRKDCRASQNS